MVKFERMDAADASPVELSEIHPRATVITVDAGDFRVYRRFRLGLLLALRIVAGHVRQDLQSVGSGFLSGRIQSDFTTKHTKHTKGGKWDKPTAGKTQH
ncbi:MAG: hypothetical protein HZA93_16520 [Verrucomicrobia bacterium]|nr:hypothetical protein [Verrucomicrobiota bacterium]